MAAADLVRRNPKCPFVMHVNVLDTVSLPICDLFRVIRSIYVENRTSGYQSAAVALVESDPPFFKPFPVGFAEFRPWQRRDTPLATLDVNYDWPYLASLESSRDAKVTVTLGQRNEVLLRQSLPVRLEPFWYWPGLGYLIDTLAFHVRNAAPAVLADEMRGMLSGAADCPGKPWGVFPAAWETLQRKGIFLEGVPGPTPTEPCDVLRPAALATRNSGTVLDMGLLLASLFDSNGVNTFLVFTAARLYLGVWLVPRMFNAAWTEDLLTLHRCLKRRDVSIVDLGFAGPPYAVPGLSEATCLSEKSLRDASFKGILDIGRAFYERDGHVKHRCPADVRLLFRYPPELLVPPVRDAGRGIPVAVVPHMPVPGPAKAEEVPDSLLVPAPPLAVLPPHRPAPPLAVSPPRRPDPFPGRGETLPAAQAAPTSPPTFSDSWFPGHQDWQDCFPDEDFDFPPAGTGTLHPDSGRPEWFVYPASPPSYLPGDSGPYWFEYSESRYGQPPDGLGLGLHAPVGGDSGEPEQSGGALQPRPDGPRAGPGGTSHVAPPDESGGPGYAALAEEPGSLGLAASSVEPDAPSYTALAGEFLGAGPG
ncbi:MAG: hypothetical protein LBR80_04245, partial [Deltaproteobacteria bacterium]|nr:hypothetical protein [Deltaproteobacteria bacterium]